MQVTSKNMEKCENISILWQEDRICLIKRINVIRQRKKMLLSFKNIWRFNFHFKILNCLFIHIKTKKHCLIMDWNTYYWSCDIIKVLCNSLVRSISQLDSQKLCLQFILSSQVFVQSVLGPFILHPNVFVHSLSNQWLVSSIFIQCILHLLSPPSCNRTEHSPPTRL